MILRKATAKDIKTLKYWDTKKHVIESGGTDDIFDWDKEIPRKLTWQEILIAEEDNRPIGVIVVIDPKNEETHYWGNIEPSLKAIDIWIGEEADLGKGYGTKMMNLILAKIFNNSKSNAVLVDPLATNTKAHSFYEKIGFKKIAHKKFGNDDCFIYKITRDEWNLRFK